MAQGSITRVAVVGTGVIGASWAAYFAARGLDVTATDPAPGAAERLRDYVRTAWPALERMGLADGVSPERVRFVPDLESCVAGADFVQENGPERIEIKRETFRRMDDAARPGAILASSSSGLKPTDFQAECRRPERVLVGHPFNPPHLIPLVEVVGGERTAEEAVAAAMSFYEAVGKKPIRIRKELTGHVANRIQAALWREAFHLVDIGAVTLAEADAAVAHGPGLRWALLGPGVLHHLSGGAGGIEHLLEHIGPLIQAMWDDLGEPKLDAALKAKLIAGLKAELAGIDQAAMVADRDRLLVDLMAAKAAAKNLP